MPLVFAYWPWEAAKKSTICVFSLGKNRVLLALDVSSAALKTPPICTTEEY